MAVVVMLVLSKSYTPNQNVEGGEKAE